MFTIEEKNRGKQKIKYDFNIGFIAALIVLFADFIGDFFKEEFNFKYYYFLKIGLPILFYFVIKLFLREEK